jgi:tetratricopeptide (TPR) repeat protein
LLVICTARPELLAQRPGWGGGRTSALTISLAPLSADETAQLVHGLLERAPLPSELQRALLERAGGVPLFAEEFARMVTERGTSELSIPESVQAIIAARLDALLPEHKRLLQDAAVVGKVFWAGAVAALDGALPDDLERGLRELLRRELLRRERQSSVEGEPEYAFRHELIRDVAYAQIPRAERSERHRRTAEWIGSLGRPDDHAELIAHHYLEALAFGRASGGDVTSFATPAMTALGEAGERAMALGAYNSAARYFKAGLELLSKGDEERARWLYRCGAALCWGENKGEQELEEAVTLLRTLDLETAARAALLLAHLEQWHADQAAIERWLAEVDDLLADHPESTVQTEALVMRSGVAMVASEGEQAIRLARQALGRMGGLDRPDLRARVFGVIGTSRVMLGDERGIDDERRAVEIAREGRAVFELDRALHNHGGSLVTLGRLKQLEENLEERRRSFEEFGGTVDASMHILAAEAFAHYVAGRWDSALDQIDSYLADLEQRAAYHLESEVRFIRALIELARDRVAQARTDIDQAIAVALRAGDPQAVAPSLCCRASILLADGQTAAAHEDFEQLLPLGERLADGLNTNAVMPQFTWLAVDLRCQGDAEPVIASNRSPRWAAAARAILAGDATTAADLLAEIGHRPAEAYARLRAGGNQLGQALGFYRSVGATRYIREAESALAAPA